MLELRRGSSETHVLTSFRLLPGVSSVFRPPDRFTTLHAEIAAAIGTVAEAVLLPN